MRKAKNYRLSMPNEVPSLRYQEKNGVFSLCIVESEIKKFLSMADEDHGHYSSELTFSFLVGRAYWSTRIKDVQRWCKSRHGCQLKAKKPIKRDAQLIQVFEPMQMIGMDWLGPISPACSITGHQYILIPVDYFSRFTLAKSYLTHTADDVIDIYESHLSPVFGQPKAAYSDNGSHFVNEKVTTYFRERGVTHFTGPISHLSSTGIMEQAVQAMISFLGATTLEHRTAGGRSNLVKNGAFWANSKFQRVHGYTPAELMLGFHPQQMHYDLRDTQYNLESPDTQDIQETPRHTQQIFMALRDENRCLSAEASAYIHYYRSKNERRQRLLKEGDLVVVRNHAVDSQKGRKLEGRWLGPRILVSYTASKLSAYVREVLGKKAKTVSFG